MSEADSTERWLPVVGYEGIYSVSDLGRVRREINGGGHISGNRWKAGMILTPSIEKDTGRAVVNLCKNAVRDRKRVHVLVLTAFVGARPEGMVACHFPDGNPANNRLSNLRWGTRKENGEDMVKHGNSQKGSKNKNAKINDDQVREVRNHIAVGLSDLKISRLMGIGRATVYDIRKCRAWSHVS